MDLARIERLKLDWQQALREATRHKADGDERAMRLSAETAVVVYNDLLQAGHRPSAGTQNKFRSDLESYGYGAEELRRIFPRLHSSTQVKKGKPTDDKDGATKPAARAPAHVGPVPWPKSLPGFPDAKDARRKTPVQGGGGLRKRWKDPKKKRIYEWDSQHGELEEWDWKGKKHLGSYDPDGNPLKGPDPKKKPITPTMAVPMDKKTKFALYWFDAEGDELVGEENLPGLTPKQVREWFFLTDDVPLTDSFIVRASQRRHLAEMTKRKIDLNKYDYFLECFPSEE
jgi:hypothetical protein